MRPLLPLLALAALAAGEAPTPAPAPTPALAQSAKPYLGVAIDPSTLDAKAAPGLAVLRVEPNSPAAVMGIQAGDRLVSLDGKALTTQEDLVKALADRKPGDQIKLDLVRALGKDNLPQRLTVTGNLQAQPTSRTATMGTEIERLKQEIADLTKKLQEPTLAQVLQQLKEVQENFPKAAAEFKKLYPDGEFKIVISIEITSDKRAKDPLTVDVGGKPGTEPTPKDAPAPAPKDAPAPAPKAP